MNVKKATLFIIITYLLSWPVAFAVFASGVKLHSTMWFVMAVYFMFTPSISAIVIQKALCRQTILGPLGISLRINRWFLIALLIPPLLAVASTLVSLVFPNVILTLDPMDGNIMRLFGKTFPEERFVELKRSVTQLPLHPYILVLIGGTIAGLTVNGVAGFGEELGWRGFLIRETEDLGFWWSSFLIGLIWGIWHIPFIIHGHNYPDHPVGGVFMMTLWTILFSPIIGYIRIRSDSVIAAAMMHGAINGTAIAPAIVLTGGDSLWVGVMGIAGIVVLAALNLFLAAFGKPKEWHNKWMERTHKSAAHP